MITPEMLAEIVAKIEVDMANVNYEIIKKIIKRLEISINELDNPQLITSSLKNILQLEASGLLYSDIEQIIEKAMPGMEKQVRTAFLDAVDKLEMFEGFEHVDRKIKSVEEAFELDTAIAEGREPNLEDLVPNVNKMSKELKAQAENAFKRTKGEMHNLTRTTASVAQKDFSQLLDKTMLKIQQGQSMDSALMEAIDEAKNLGAKIRYPSGHEDYIEVALARAVRTGINQANTNMILTKCGEVGINYVKTSSHLGARVTKQNDHTNHSWWQGQVYRLNWNDPALQDFKVDGVDYSDKSKAEHDTRKKNRKRGTSGKYVNTFKDFSVCGYGKVDGLCGINCRHTIMIHFPNISDNTPDRIDKEENEKRYALEQKQRAMERNIRAIKREIAKYEELDSPTAQKKYNSLNDLLAKKMRQYVDFCSKNNLPLREWGTKIHNNNTNRLKSDIINNKVHNAVLRDKYVKGKYPTSDEEIQSVIENELSGVRFSADIKYNPRIKTAGKTQLEYYAWGQFKGVKKIEIGKQVLPTKEELIDSILHEELEVRLSKKYRLNELLKMTDTEIHGKIDKIIERIFKGKGWNYGNTRNGKDSV